MTNKQYLETIRESLRDCSVSYGELCDLQNMKEFIHPTDIELSEAAGISEDEYNERLENYIKIIEAIKYYEDKIAKQGRVINARDAEHLGQLKTQLNKVEK
jgi:hypothetical protein